MTYAQPTWVTSITVDQDNPSTGTAIANLYDVDGVTVLCTYSRRITVTSTSDLNNFASDAKAAYAAKQSAATVDQSYESQLNSLLNS